MKKKQHSLNFLIIVLLDGRIIFHSNPEEELNDQRLWKKMQIRKDFKDKEYGIFGDGGFYFNRKKDKYLIKGLKPFKKSKKRKLTEEEKLFNTNISKQRVVVENTIGKIKEWRVLSGCLRYYSFVKKNWLNINEILSVCCNLTQLMLLKKPLRDKNFRIN